VLNALRYHGIPSTDQRTQEFQELVDLVKCRIGPAISIEKAVKKLGLKGGEYPYRLKKLPLPFMMTIHLRGFHAVLCVGQEGDSLRLVNVWGDRGPAEVLLPIDEIDISFRGFAYHMGLPGVEPEWIDGSPFHRRQKQSDEDDRRRPRRSWLESYAGRGFYRDARYLEGHARSVGTIQNAKTLVSRRYPNSWGGLSNGVYCWYIKRGRATYMVAEAWPAKSNRIWSPDRSGPHPWRYCLRVAREPRKANLQDDPSKRLRKGLRKFKRENPELVAKIKADVAANSGRT